MKHIAGERVLTGADLEEYVKATQLWFETAGKASRSEVTAIDLSEDGSTARCSVKTIYERAGEQGESLVLTKIGDLVLYHLY